MTDPLQGKKRPSGRGKGLADVSPYLTVGISLAGAMLVYVGLGYLVDRWLGTSPTYLIVGSVAGMVSFFVQLYRLTKDLTAQNKQRQKNKKMPPSS